MELTVDVRENKTWYRWHEGGCNITILKSEDCDFYTTAVDMAKDKWQIELISYKAHTIQEAKSIAEQMVKICQWYISPEPNI